MIVQILTPRAKSLSAWLVASIAIFLTSLHISEPGILPDELCHLGWARLLAGAGGLYAMGGAGYCEPGYALLLAPLHWLFDANDAVYRGALAINALLAGACLPLSRHLGSTHLGMSERQAWVIGLLAICYPAMLVYSRYALPETLLYLLTLLWFATWSNWVDTRNFKSLALLIGAAFALYAAHSRMIAFVLILAAGSMAWLAVSRRHHDRLQAWIVIFTVAAGLFLLHAVKQHAVALAWTADPTMPLDRIAFSAAPSTFASMLSNAAGQLLFALLATVGLALLPLAWVLTKLWCSGPRLLLSDPGTFKLVAAPTMLLVIAIESSIFLNGADRFDLAFYGRYPGPLIMLSMIVGLALLVDGRARRSSIALIAIVAIALLLATTSSHLSIPYSDYSRIHVVGALPIIDWLSKSSNVLELRFKLVGIVSVATLCALLLLRRDWRWYFSTVLASMLGLLAVDTYPRGPTLASHIPRSVANALAKTPCSIYWAARIKGRVQIHQKFRLQYLFPHCQVITFDGPGCAPPKAGVAVVPGQERCGMSDVDSHEFTPGLRVLHASKLRTDSAEGSSASE